jgi:hypothetical protein
MNSAANEPTPPKPTTITCFCVSKRKRSSPIKRLVLDNQEISISIFMISSSETTEQNLKMIKLYRANLKFNLFA